MRIVINNNPIANVVKEQAKEQVQQWILGGLEASKIIAIELSYSVALVGGGICILLWLSGWRDGKRWAGILFMVNILIHFLFGGSLK